MMIRALLAAAAVAVVVAATLAGCTPGDASSSPKGGSPSQSSSNPAGSPTPPDTAAPTEGSTAAPIANQCHTAELAGSLGPGEGGAAGHVGVTLLLTNRAAEQCSLQGWPGVSFVGQGNGTQLGAAAVFQRNTPHPVVVLSPGGTAQAMLLIGNAANYPKADCAPEMADGFRVYPPGSATSLFVASKSFTACTKNSAPLLQVGALIGG